MSWVVELDAEFDLEFAILPKVTQKALTAKIVLIRSFGPQLSRPHADTLKGSSYSNMKELRFRVGSEIWRAAYAFDANRRCIVLVAANKRGKDQARFYRELIEIADARFGKYR